MDKNIKNSIETIKKNKTEILKRKNTMSKLHNPLGRVFKIRFCQTEERINKLEDR